MYRFNMLVVSDDLRSIVVCLTEVSGIILDMVVTGPHTRRRWGGGSKSQGT